ncbi:hypothetical protein BS78_K112200 [Paspalum vaginatum]|uniref:At1g61320/AtMIF1 LRR domain-containing protein n=1 Tax=Paspalum vaginatum TaxID=158149 RepID=A0A9W7XCX8_9POAL|nr:hypothetical protein BS78_K112200 [Paspalum vaginatum]
MERIPTRSVMRQPRQQGQTKDDGSPTSLLEIKGSICQKEDGVQGDERRGSGLNLPEDLLYYVHALMPMRDAACAAGVSCGFLRSWGSFPNLIFDIDTLGINDDYSKIDEITTDFISRVDHIMRNHSGTGVKIFSLRTYPCDSVHPSYIDRWLQIAITPGIEEFELLMPWQNKIEYNFPCWLLSTERGSSLQSFSLDDCAFHPALEVGCLSGLKCLRLSSVHITAEELCAFLSKSLSLEQLDLLNCSDIVCLKIPFVLLQLNSLKVQDCIMLELIEIDAPNLSQFLYAGRPIHISLGYPLQLRHIQMSSRESRMLYWVSTNLPSVAPNLQTLYLAPCWEVVNTPIVLPKFIHLKYLEIVLAERDHFPGYDFCSLVSFLDGSPSLGTFILRVDFLAIRHDSIIEYPDYSSLQPRRLPQHRRDNLKNVLITGFCSAKSMIELTNHIIGSASALEYLTLDTSRGHEREIHKSIICMHMPEEALVEVQRARLAFARHVEGNVPSTVNLRFIEPCSKCLSFDA